jgi:hypothetical protein
MAYALVKRHKRLMIVDETGGVIYQPPNFLRPVTNRDDFAPLVSALNETGELGGDVLTAFETRFNPRVRPSAPPPGYRG